MRVTSIVLLSVAAAFPVSAANFIVTSIADSGPGSLRAAMAGLAPGQNHTIDFSLPANAIIQLVSPLPAIRGNIVVIDGIDTPGLGVVSINGTRIFQTDPASPVNELTLRDFFVGNGSADQGGCLYNPAPSSSVLQLQGMMFQNCLATGGTNNNGGAVLSFGTVDIFNSRFVNNLAFNPTGGTLVTQNRGGAIAVSGSLRVVASQFIRNGIAVNPPSIVAIGAAIDASGDVTILASHFLENAINGSTNVAYATVYCATGTCLLTGNSFHGNRGMVLVTYATNLFVTNTTFVDNAGSPAMWVFPGSGLIRLNNLTFLNRVLGTTVNGAHLGVQLVAPGQTPDIAVSNTLFGPTASGNACVIPPIGANGGGYNLAVDTSCNVFANGTSLVVPGTLGLLDPSTATPYGVEVVPLMATSPAVDRGSTGLLGTDAHACPAIDARGMQRPQDGNNDGTPVCDIGAFELQTDLLLVDGFEG